MTIGIMGTGVVGRTIAAKFAELGHTVFIGTRDVADTLSRTSSDAYGNPPFKDWLQQNPKVKLLSFAGAAAGAELLVNATNGAGTLEALAAAGEKNLRGKVLIDISDPLDFSKGMPPSLLISNTDSLGEQVQRTFPATRVVKTLNTVNALVMVNPQLVAGGDHHMFVSGNDAEAKAKVIDLLKKGLGWKHVIDLGDITTARGTEMYLPLWVRLWGALRTPMFNIKIAQ